MWELACLTPVLFKGQQYLHLLWLLRYFDLFLPSYFVSFPFFYLFFPVSCLIWNKSRFLIPFSTSLHIIFFILLNKIRALELAQVKYHPFQLAICFICPFKLEIIISVFYMLLLLFIFTYFTNFLFTIGIFDIFLLSGFNFLFPKV